MWLRFVWLHVSHWPSLNHLSFSLAITLSSKPTKVICAVLSIGLSSSQVLVTLVITSAVAGLTEEILSQTSKLVLVLCTANHTPTTSTATHPHTHGFCPYPIHISIYVPYANRIIFSYISHSYTYMLYTLTPGRGATGAI